MDVELYFDQYESFSKNGPIYCSVNFKIQLLENLIFYVLNTELEKNSFKFFAPVHFYDNIIICFIFERRSVGTVFQRARLRSLESQRPPPA